MSFFSDIKKDESMEEAKDVVGGGSRALATDIYDAILKLAYPGESKSGAKNVTILLDVGGTEVRETIYFTTGAAKGTSLTYEDKTTKKKMPLPGYSLLDDLAMFTTEDELLAQEAETKTIKVWNPESRAEENQEKPVFTAMIGKPVRVALNRVKKDKTKQGDDGQYHPTGETFTTNECVKFLHPETSRTINEYKHGVEEPEFATAWEERWAGKDKDESTGEGETTGQSGSGRPGGGEKKKTTSLFGK